MIISVFSRRKSRTNESKTVLSKVTQLCYCYNDLEYLSWTILERIVPLLCWSPHTHSCVEKLPVYHTLLYCIYITGATHVSQVGNFTLRIVSDVLCNATYNKMTHQSPGQVDTRTGGAF